MFLNNKGLIKIRKILIQNIKEKENKINNNFYN